MTDIYIAFDGAIVSNSFPYIGTPADNAIKWIKQFQKLGATIYLCANRNGKELEQAFAYLERAELSVETKYATNSVWHCPADGIKIDVGLIDIPVKFCGTSLTDVINWDKLGPMVETSLCNKR